MHFKQHEEKRKKTQLHRWHLGLLSNVASPQKKSTALWCSEATVLLIHCSTSGWYYWRRQIKGLEGFWQVDKCCLTRQSTGQAVRCSLTALTLRPSATKGFELLSLTHTERSMDLSPRTRPLSVWTGCVWEAGSRTVFFFLSKTVKKSYIAATTSETSIYARKILPKKTLISTAGSAQGQTEKLIMASIRADTVWEERRFICLCWGCRVKGKEEIAHSFPPLKMNED